MLKLEKVEIAYGIVPVVQGISFHVEDGELISIVGANGAGKTTIMKAIAGRLHPRKGSINFRGKDITKLSSPDIVRMGITYVPESRRLFTPLSVEENLEIGAYIINDKKEIEKNLEFVYGLFPRLKERRKQRAGTLSGGEQQMLAIGRGLMANPKLLMLDEPSQGLMPILVTELLNAVKKLKELGMTILLVEQNVQEALEIADRGYVLQTGQIITEGNGKELLDSDIVKKAFLGM
ncbi:MAG: ABC transporter ATP-binding protein [Deltaproteobacteria bacterium]|nr:MAG: ABC transporter ATP-binding protein [Deltaproteobacteria bacterium]